MVRHVNIAAHSTIIMTTVILIGEGNTPQRELPRAGHRLWLSWPKKRLTLLSSCTSVPLGAMHQTRHNAIETIIAYVSHDLKMLRLGIGRAFPVHTQMGQASSSVTCTPVHSTWYAVTTSTHDLTCCWPPRWSQIVA